MQAYELPIHFGSDEGKHQINADSLAVFIDAYKEIFEGLYGSKIKIEIGVPEEGGWKTKLTIVAALGGWFLNFVGVDNMSILLTGEKSEVNFARAHEIIKDFLTKKAENTSEVYPRKCIEQKNKIYQQFQKDNCIDSFDLGGTPPILKTNFHLYIQELPDDENVYLGITNITVSSPVWQSKRNRSWLGKIEIVEDVESAFDFDKDLTGKFWEHVKLDTLPLHTTDVMSVQLIFRTNNRVKYRVIRVLHYNGISIDSPLSSESISKLTTDDLSARAPKSFVEQLELFPQEQKENFITGNSKKSEAQE